MEIVIATDNEGKIKEFKEILTPLNFKVISKKEAGIFNKIEETGTSFIENAKIKANFIFDKTKKMTLADDSGLEVFSLNNRPGIFSARYSQEKNSPATDEKNNIKLLKELENKENRKARYVCALCFINKKKEIFSIIETVEGEIAKTPKGTNGFGYDPLFLYNGKSFGETKSEIKNKISHRGKAIKKLLENIKNWVWLNFIC